MIRNPGPKTKHLGHNPRMGFLGELGRRRVYRMVGFYVVAAWVAIQSGSGKNSKLGRRLAVCLPRYQ